MDILRDLEDGVADAVAIKLGQVENSTLEIQRITFYKSFSALSNFIFGGQEIGANQGIGWINDSKAISRALKESPIRFLRRKSIEIKMFKRFYFLRPQAISWVLLDAIRPQLLRILFLVHEVIAVESSDLEKVEKTMRAFQLYTDLSLKLNVSYDDRQTANHNILVLRSHMIEFMYCWFYPRAETTYEDLKRIENWKQTL
jgi:hypothetical protein